jgi:hypothetical protein
MKFPPRPKESFKDYLKLKPGESIRGVFRGSPYRFRQHWENNVSSICESECSLCQQGKKASFRFRINFLTLENGAYVAKVFEQGGKVYDALSALNESDYDLERTVVKITRNGNGTDTTYSVVPVPKGDVSDELEKKLIEVKLNELDPQAEATPPETDEDLPF